MTFQADMHYMHIQIKYVFVIFNLFIYFYGNFDKSNRNS